LREYSFERLEVWQLSKKLTIQIYLITKSFPESEKFGVINQIRRASFSISNNLAEGNSRSSIKDRVRFIEIAFGSLMEVLNILLVSKELGFIDDISIKEIRPLIEEIGNKMNALRSSFHKSSNQQFIN